MRKLHNSTVILFLFCLPFAGCRDEVIEIYKASVPVYMSYPELRSAVRAEAPAPLNKPGKIYFKDNFIYINEYFKGIHVIDNTNPSSPVTKAFINIPGNVDMAIKNNILYADSYIDLVALDISDPTNVRELHRIKDVFPYAMPAKPVEYTEGVDQAKGVVIGWEVKEIKKEKKEPYPYPYPQPFYYEDYSPVSSMPYYRGSQGGSTTGAVGTGGSMARFAIRDTALYTLTNYQIKVLDITNISTPVTKNTLQNVWGIETIFLNGNYMYIGAQNGMHIFDISNPLNPSFISTYSHVTSCDPVVVQGNYAFVTLRAGVTCRNTVTNQLDVIDVSDKEHPVLVHSYAMTEPKGLGIDNTLLFICDGPDGLKIYNASDVNKVTQNLVSQFKDIVAFDVIPYNGVLFVIGEGGLYEYDYSNLQNIKLLSKIEVKK